MKNPLKTLPIAIKDGRIKLNFKLSDVKNMAIVGIDLVALMQDGTRLLLPGMALKLLEKPSPELQFEDQQLSGAELFTRVDIDSTTLEDAARALQVPVSQPADTPSQDGSGDTQAAPDGAAQDAAAANDGKGAEEPLAWYQQYGWIFGLVGVVGLALGLSGGKKKKEDDSEDKPSAPSVDTPVDTPDDKPDVPADKPAEADFIVSGGLAAGVFNHAQTLSVTLYGGQGQQLGQGELVVGDRGQVLSYRAKLPADYTGFVRVAVSDGARDGLGFIDEFRQAMALARGMTQDQADALASTDFPSLSAIGYRAPGQAELNISVTPLTELVVRLLGAPADPAQALDGVLTAEQVTAMADAVARLVTQLQLADTGAQLLDILGPVVAINADNFAAASSDAQTYGKVLAGLAGVDAASGALEQTLALLTQGLSRDENGVLSIAPTVEGAILLAAMQQANAQLDKLADHALFENFTLPQTPWADVSAQFADAAGADSPDPMVDWAGRDKQPGVIVSWPAHDIPRIAAGQTVGLYLLDGSKLGSHTVTQDEVDAGRLVLAAADYGEKTLGEDGVKRLFAAIADGDGKLVARSPLHAYGLVGAEVDAITELSADTGISPSDFITNQPLQAVSGTYVGVLGPDSYIEVSADGGRTWVKAMSTPAVNGADGGAWVSGAVRLDAFPPDAGQSRLLSRVTVPGANGEQPLTLPGASHDFVLDIAPPDAAVASIDSISNPLLGAEGFLFSQAAQTIRGAIQGNATDDDRVMVSIDGGVNWILGELNPADQTWSASVGFARPGAGEILARITDVAGNATATVTHSYNYVGAVQPDAEAPTQAVHIVAVTDTVGDPEDDPYDFAGELSPGMSTDDRRPSLNGTLSAPLIGDQMVVLYHSLNGGAETLLAYVNVAPPQEEGGLPTWSYQPAPEDRGLMVGKHHIVAKVYSPGANAWSPPYPEGVDPADPQAQSNWGSWDLNIQSISFDGVIIPGVTSVNLLDTPNRVTDNTHPTLTGALGTTLGPGEYLALYDSVNGRAPRLAGRPEIKEAADGSGGATWSYAFRGEDKLADGEHALRVVIEREGQDGEPPRALLSSAAPSVIISTELPNQEVTIDQVRDDVGIYIGAIANGASTDDASPSLSGTLSAALLAGQRLLVRVENVERPDQSFTYLPVLNQEDLTWSLTIDPPLPAGHYNLAAGVVNGGGAMGPLSASFDLRINSLTFSTLEDAVGPIVGNVFAGNEPFLTDDRIPVLGGHLGTALGEGEALQIVSTQNGHSTVLGVVGPANLRPDEAGGFTWRLKPAISQDGQGQLPDGNSTLTAQIIDTRSNLPLLQVDRSISVDDGAPVETANITEVRDAIPGAANGFVGPLAPGQSTDDRQPVISGTLTGGEQTLPVSRAVQITDTVTAPDGTVTRNVLGLATIQGNGRWTFTPEAGLQLGDHALSARVVNLANGESGPGGREFTVRENQITLSAVQDNVGALVGNLLDARLFAQPPVTDDSRPQFSGRLGTATVTDTAWTFTPPNPLGDGAHLFQARVERVQGGTLAQTLLSASTPSITIDSTTTPITQTLETLTITDNVGDDGSKTGAVGYLASMDDPKPSISGTLSAAVSQSLKVRVFMSYNDGAERVLGDATVNGRNWSYALTDPLPYGLVTILARVVSPTSGLTSNTLASTINVNSIALTGITEAETGVNVLNRQGHGSGDNHLTLHGKLGAPLVLRDEERVALYLKRGDSAAFAPIGMATIAANGADWSYQLSDAAGRQQAWQDGNYTISVRIEDKTSRSARAVTETNFSVDTGTPEQLASISGYEDQTGEWQSLITQSGISTDEARGIVRGTLDQAIDGHTRGVVLYERIDGQLMRLGQAQVTETAWEFTMPQAFVPGVHSLVARVENLAASKVGAQSTAFDIHVQQIFLESIANPDTPDHNILTPPIGGAVAQGALTIKGHLGAPLAEGETLKIAIDGRMQEDQAVIDANGLDWSYTLADVTELGNASHSIVAQVMSDDDAPRAASTPYTVHVDNAAPSETVTITRARDNYANGPSFTGEIASGIPSDDPLPLLKGIVSGVLPGGRSVAVYGQMPGQAQPALLGYAAVAGKEWTFQVNQELPFGDTVFTARVVNRAAPDTLRGEASANFVVHEQGLSITALIDDQGAVTGDLFQSQAAAPAGEPGAGLRTNDLRPTLQGALAAPLQAGETLSIFQGKTRLGAAEIKEDGLSWSFTPRTDVAQGAQHFSAVLATSDGISRISAQTPEILISTPQPGQAVFITSISDSNNPSGPLLDQPSSDAPAIEVEALHNAVAVLDDARPVLSGNLARALNASEVVHVYVTDDSGARHLLGQAAASGTAWSLSLPVSLPSGARQLLAAVENKADSGGAAWSAPVGIEVVSLSPISIDGLSRLGAVESKMPTLHGSIGSNNHMQNLSVHVRVDGVEAGASTVDAHGKWSFQIPRDLSVGMHQVEYALFNDGAPVAAVARGEPVRFLVSGGDAPSFSVTLHGADTPILTDRGLTVLTGAVSGSVAPGMGVMVAVNGQDVGLAGLDATGQNWSYSLWARLPGAYDVTVRPINLATLASLENSGAQAVVHQNRITIDAPPDALTLPDGGFALLASNTPVTLTGRLAQPLPADVTLQLWRDDELLGPVEIAENGLTWRYSPLPQDLPRQDSHRYRVTAQNSHSMAVSELSAQTTMDFVPLDSAPSSLLFVSITDVADTAGKHPVSANMTVTDRFPLILGTASGTLTGRDQIVVYGQASGDAERTRLGVAHMLTDTTWEFRSPSALPLGDYTLTAVPEDRLTGLSRPFAQATTTLQLQRVTITEVNDDAGAIRGNVLENSNRATDDGTPLIQVELSAPLRAGQQTLRVTDSVNGGKAALLASAAAEDLNPDTPLVYRFKPATPLSDGRHTLRVEVVENNTARVQASHQVSFVMDAGTPGQTVSITSVRDDAGDAQGNVADMGAIAYPRPLVSGTISAALSNAQVLRIWQDAGNGAAVHLGDATVNGKNWTWRPNVDLPSGSINLFATVDNAAKAAPDSEYSANDPAHGKPSSVFSFRLLTLGDVQIHDAHGELVNGSTTERRFTISGKLSAPLINGEYVEIRDGDRVLGRAAVEEDLNWRFSTSQLLGNGEHPFKVSIAGGGNAVPLVYDSRAVIIHEAAPDPLQAGLIEAVIALQPEQALAADSAFDTLTGQSARPGQSLRGDRVGLFGTLAVAPRDGDQVQLYDNGAVLGVAQVAGTRWWYNADSPLSAGEHVFTLFINGQAVPSRAQGRDAAYPIHALDGDAIRIDDLESATYTAQTLRGSLHAAPGADETLGVYRTLNGKTVRLGDARVSGEAGADGRYAWAFTPDAALPLGLGAWTLTLQLEGATHARIAAAHSVDVLIDEAAIAATATILSVSTAQPTGLVSVEPGARVANPALIVSGSLDRDLLGSERVALYDGDNPVGYATLSASGRNWTYMSTGMGNGQHLLKAVVENNAGSRSDASPAFEVNVVAQVPGQVVTFTGARANGTAPLGSSAALDTNGFSVFAWNMRGQPTRWDVENLWTTAELGPTGQAQVPEINFGTYTRAFLPGVPYAVMANYVGSAWFHVSPEQAGLWMFRSPKVDDFVVVSVDGERIIKQNYTAKGVEGGINLDAGWHYLRIDTGNIVGPGYWTMLWRRPGESSFSVIKDVQTGLPEKTAALGATDKPHALTLDYALSAPLKEGEALQVRDLTAHRTADGLRLQFWNLPQDENRTLQEGLALLPTVAPVVSRMTDSLKYDARNAYDNGVDPAAFSMMGNATGWFHVSQAEAGVWLFRGTTRFDQVLLRIDGHTVLSPDRGIQHAQYASAHLEAGWHYLDSTLFQGANPAADWEISALRPGDADFAKLTGFAQFESGILGAATVDGADPTAFSFETTINDGNSHTLWATVVTDESDATARPPMEHGQSGLVFLANGAFGIVDKKVEVAGDGQWVNFAARHGAINLVDLDPGNESHVHGNTLVMDSGDLQQADVGSAAAYLDIDSTLLDNTFRQLIVRGGEHDVLKFDAAGSSKQWQESGNIEVSDSHYTVFTDSSRTMQLIVDTHVALDLDGALRSNAHPVI